MAMFKFHAIIRFPDKTHDYVMYADKANINDALSWGDQQVVAVAEGNHYWLKISEPIPEGVDYPN